MSQSMQHDAEDELTEVFIRFCNKFLPPLSFKEIKPLAEAVNEYHNRQLAAVLKEILSHKFEYANYDEHEKFSTMAAVPVSVLEAKLKEVEKS